MAIQAPDTFERAIIGCITNLDGDKARKLALSISPDFFHHPRNRYIYELLQGPALAGTPLGSQTAVATVKQSPLSVEHFGGTEGAVEAVMAMCEEACDPFESWEQYAKQLKLAHTRRILSTTFDEAANEAASASSVQEASSIALGRVIDAANLLKPIMDEQRYGVTAIGMDYIDAYKADDLATPFPQHHLNTIGGIRPGEICILSAYTGFYKSWVAIDWATVWMKMGRRIKFFTLEMPSSQVLERMIAMEYNVAHENLIKRLIPIDEVSNYIGSIADHPLEIVQGVTTAQDIMASAYTETKPDIVFVDHLQLLSIGGKPDMKRISLDEVLLQFKGWAVDNNIALVILSQLRRPELRASQKLPRPQIFMLKESGGIEQIADYVVFVHREMREQSVGFCSPTYEEKVMSMWCDKQRNGEPAPEEVMHFRNYRMR